MPHLHVHVHVHCSYGDPPHLHVNLKTPLIFFPFLFSHQLTILCIHLDRMWASNQGNVVLYSWYQFMTSDILATLGIGQELRLEYEDPAHPSPSWDPRAVQDITRPRAALSELLAHDRTEKEREFADAHFDCDVCFMSVLGSKCVQHQPCGHTHCHDCLRSYLTSKIGSGEVTHLECPSRGCATTIHPLTIKRLVPDLYNRYVCAHCMGEGGGGEEGGQCNFHFHVPVIKGTLSD